MKKYVNTIVRIGRVVVHPELRGLGLARHLINASKEYSKSRWQITGKRPIFLEISAEMLNYIDFVSSSGFQYVGHTEGNYARIVKDLSYMQKGYDINSGIMSLQKKYLTAVQSYCRETRMPFEQALARLEFILSCDDPASGLTPSEWAAFRKVLRPKIPYYLCALDDSAEAYLRPLRGRTSPRKQQKFGVVGARIDIASISVKSVVSLPLTRNVRIIMDAFGLDGDSIESLVLPPIAAMTPHLDLLAGVGADIVIVAHTGNAVHTDRSHPLAKPPRLADRDWAAFGRRLDRVAAHVGARGMRLAYHHHLGTVVETAADLDRLLAATGPAVGLTLDTGHALCGGIDPVAVVRAWPDRIVHVHAKDVRTARHAAILRDGGSFLDGVVAGMFTAPGDGDYDYAPFVAALRAIEYAGWIVIEAEQDPAIADPRTYARSGLQTLRRLVEGAA